MKTLKVIDVFTDCPGGRSRKDGSGSAQEFYEDILLPAFKIAIETSEALTVDLDDSNGYAGSWIDEAFGRLTQQFTYKQIVENLHIVCKEEPELRLDISNAIIQWTTNGPPDNSPLVKEAQISPNKQ